MIVSILVILTIFTMGLLVVWLWFFNAEREPGENYQKHALKAFSVGDYKKAKELFLKLPKNGLKTDSFQKLGVACLKLGEYDEAKGYFEEILKKNPKNVEALSSLAQIFQAQQKYDEALEIYNKIASENPKNIDGLLNAGELYYEKGDVAKAFELFEKAKKLSPDNTKVLFSTIKCKSKMSDNDSELKKIIEEFKKLENRKDLPSGYNIAIAKTYAIIGDIEKALDYSKKAIVSDSENIECYQLLGLIYLIKQDFNSAKNHLSTALNFQPNNKETHNIFSYVLCHQVDSCTLSKCRENYYKLIKTYLK